MDIENLLFYIDTLCTKTKTKLFHNNIGYIHSVFENVINIKVEDNIYSITTGKINPTPMSIKTGLNISPRTLIKHGDRVYVDNSSIKIRGLSFYLGKETLWNSKLGEQIFNLPEEIDCIIINVINLLQKNKGASDVIKLLSQKKDIYPINITSMEMYKILQQVESQIINKEFKRAGLTLSRLIGLGEGLTPSGDDFLIGLLSLISQPAFSKGPKGHEICVMYQGLIQGIKNNLEKTTDISSEYLKYAIENRFSLVIHQLIKGIAESDKGDIFKYSYQLGKIGATSGCDTLIGMIFALKLSQIIL